MRKCFVSGDRKTLVWAFATFVRPILEFSSPVWSPHQIGDIDLIESVQRNFTKYLPGLYNLSYSERLRLLGLDSLELRRLKADLCLTHAILHNLVDFDSNLFFTVRGCERTRGHPLKLVVQQIKRDCRKYFFACRVVHVWNALPSEAVMATTRVCFKKRLNSVVLDKYVKYA